MQQSRSAAQGFPSKICSSHGQQMGQAQRQDDDPPHLRGAFIKQSQPESQLLGGFHMASPSPQKVARFNQPQYGLSDDTSPRLRQQLDDIPPHLRRQHDDVPAHIRQQQLSQQAMMQGQQTPSPSGLPPGFGRREFPPMAIPPHQTLSQV